jgi:hypothetical protein
MKARVAGVVVFCGVLGLSLVRDSCNSSFQGIEKKPVQSWNVPYGQEFWRVKAQAQGSNQIDTANVIERVSHAFEGDKVVANAYQASVDHGGIRFAPRNDPSSEASLRTISISRGGEIVPGGQGSWSVYGNTAQRLFSGPYGLVEHCQARQDGLELSWVLRQPLAGPGTLRLEVAIEGFTYHSTTASGHHFADGEGVARLRIGPVTIVDSAGNRSEGRSEVRGDILLVQVSEDILGQAQYPLAIDPLISPEFGIDEPVPGLAGGNQIDPAVACNGRDYLVVWINPSPGPSGGQGDIRGTRVRSSDGLILDVGGLPISTAPQNQRNPVVASDGTDYFVAWVDDRNFSQTSADIYGTKITSDGRVVAPNGVAVCNLSGSQEEPGIACNGSNYLVVWTQGRVMGTFVGRDGVVISTNVPIATGAPTKFAPAVASDGQDYLVVWHQASATQEDIYGARVSSAGEVLDPAGFSISTAASIQSYPSVAGNSGGYLVAWLDRRSGAHYDIFAARVAPTGEVLDPDGIGIYPGPGDQFQPAVTAAAGEFHIVYTQQSSASLYLARVNSEGYLLDFDPLLLATGRTWHERPALASNNEQTFVVFASTPPGVPSQTDIVGLRLYLDGAPYDPRGFPISLELNAQNAPAVAANGQNFLIVWQDGRGESPRNIYGARAAADGTILDVQGLAISTAPGEQEFPSVASNGRDFLVVWRDTRDFLSRGYDLYGARVTAEGVVRETNGIPLATTVSYEMESAVAGNENGYLVTWRMFDYNIRAQHVSNEGALAGPTNLDLAGANPAVASNGRDYMVVWQGQRLGDSIWKLYGARLSSTGALLDPAPVPIHTQSYNHLFPAIASDGRNYFVVWEGSLFPWEGPDIFGEFVSSEGVAAAAFPIFRDNPLQSFADVVFDGRDYLVLCEDQRNANRSGTDIYGAKVTTGGLVFPNGGFAVNASAGNQLRPAAAALDGNVLAVCQSPTNIDLVRLSANLITRGLPSPWQNQDIGSAPLPGDADAADGAFLVRGSGAAIGQNADAFHFVFQPLSGRVQVKTRLARTESGFAGIVIRESLDAGARHAFLGISLNHLVFGWRDAVNGSTQVESFLGSWPVWLRLLRIDNTVLALQSYDGWQWHPVGSITLDLPNDVLVGLAVGSSDDSQLNTASFEEVSVFPSGVSTDSDSDGVPDPIDLCPVTTLGTIPNATGCSVTQLCPCESMRSQDDYITCIETNATAFYRAGLITHAQQRALIEQASSTECPPLFGNNRGIVYGLLHTSLGSGILQFDGECNCSLRVESPGTGDDPFGVSVFLGEADSGAFIYPTAGEWGNYDPEWFLMGQAYGRMTSAGHDALIASVRVTKPGYEVYPVDVDLSPLEPQSLTFQVFSNDTVLAEATTPGAIGRIVVNSAPLVVPRGNPFWRMSDGNIGVLIEFTDTTEIFDEDPWPRFGVSGPFGNGIRGNRVFIRANQPAKRALYCSRVDVFANIPFSIDDERLGMFSHAHKALGPVLFDTAGGRLTVAHHSRSEPQDWIGTIIEETGTRLEVDLKPLVLDMPESVFRLSAGGWTDSEDGYFTEASLTHRDGKLILDASSYSETRHLKVFRNGSLVGAAAYSNNVATATLSLKNNHIPTILGCSVFIESSNMVSLSISFKELVDFTLSDGASLRGNNLRITAITSQPVIEIRQLALEIAGIHSFTITGERSEVIPPALRITSSSGKVVLTWPDNTRLFTLEAAPSLNVPFTRLTNEVDFLDNQNVLTLPVDSGIRFFQLNSPQ